MNIKVTVTETGYDKTTTWLGTLISIVSCSEPEVDSTVVYTIIEENTGILEQVYPSYTTCVREVRATCAPD